MAVQRFSFEAQCKGKVRYPTKREAKRSCRSAEQYVGRMQAYRCPWCSAFHIGHPPPRELRQPA